MSLTVKESTKVDRDPIPTGLHHAVCYGLIDIGTQPAFGSFPSRPKVLFMWELPGETIEFEKDGVTQKLPRAISQKYTASLSDRGNLRPMLEAWRGRPFTAEELAGFDLKNVVGANCFIGVVHKLGKGKNAGKTYAEVDSVNPLPKGMVKVKPVNPLITFSMDEGTGPIQIPEGIPEWIQNLIKASDEYQIRAEQKPHEAAPPAGDAASENPDDDIPF